MTRSLTVRTKLLTNQKLKTRLLVLLSIFSIALGAYLLKSMLAAGGDFSDAAREADYVPPLANVQSGEVAVSSPNSSLSLIFIVATSLFLALPIAGAVIYWLRNRKA